MDKEELHLSLESLHDEVNRLDIADETGRQRINHLISELEKQIENPDNTEQRNNLRNKVTNLIEDFEVEHPRITETLNRIMLSLSDMGI